MSTLDLDEAQARLREIVAGLQPGEELVLMRDGIPVATIRKLLPLGTLKGSVLHIAPDFDDIPEGFEEYLDGYPEPGDPSSVSLSCPDGEPVGSRAGKGMHGNGPHAIRA